MRQLTNLHVYFCFIYIVYQCLLETQSAPKWLLIYNLPVLDLDGPRLLAGNSPQHIGSFACKDMSHPSFVIGGTIFRQLGQTCTLISRLKTALFGYWHKSQAQDQVILCEGTCNFRNNLCSLSKIVHLQYPIPKEILLYST